MSEISKVLIVDDDMSLSFLISEALQGADFVVEELHSGEECIEQADEIAPDIVLLDVLMPGIDGYEVCRQLRKKSQFMHTPILMMTGMDDELSVQSSFMAGATDFIAKPFNITLLLQRIAYIARNGRVTKELVNSERRLAQAQALAKLAYWELNAKTGAVVWSNSAADIFQTERLNTGNLDASLFSRVAPEDKTRVSIWFNAIKKQETTNGITHAIVTDDGETVYLNQQVKTSYNEDGELEYLYGSLLDVTEMHEAQSKIRKLAYYDGITNLPNRAYFKELLENTLSNCQRYKRVGALFFIDLDNFKRINDTMGHPTGDLLLASVGEAIEASVRDVDVVVGNGDNLTATLARIGGDEFTLILPELKKAVDAGKVAQRILEVLEKPFDLDGNKVTVTASIGIAVIPEDGDTAEALLQTSDIAMYYAKADGKNTFKFFNQEMNMAVKNRMSMENAMRQALTNNEFRLVYQPQINIDTGEMHGVEALIRWNSPTLGHLSPLEFIPIAEETGLIVSIGYWVIKEACQQAKKWIENGLELNRMAVNVSARQFSQIHFDKMVADILDEVGLPAKYLELELTESALMKQDGEAINILNRLKKIGVNLSIDDFGTGYSSLAYLKQFPINHLKIDKAFIDEVNTDQNNAAIVKAVIAIAASMELRVTAEGVEESEQLEFLKMNLCDEVQGYYYSKPLHSDDIEEFAKQFSPKKRAFSLFNKS